MSSALIFRNFLALALRLLIVLIISLFTTRAVLQNLGVLDYGIFVVIHGLVGLLAFLSSAMSTGTQRFISIEIGRMDKEGANLRYNAATSIHFALAIFFLIAASSFGDTLLQSILVLPDSRLNELVVVLKCLAVVVVVNILSVPAQSLLNAHERMDIIAAISVLQAAMNLCLALGLYYADTHKLVYYSAGLALINTLALFSLMIVARTKFPSYRIRLIHLRDMTAIRGQLGFSIWNLFGSVASIAQNQGLSILLNNFYGPAVNAAFGISQQIYMQLSTLSATLTKAFSPQIVKSEGSGKRSKLIELTYLTSKYTFLLLFVFCMPLISNSKYLLSVWLVEVPNFSSNFVELIVVMLLVNQITVSLIIAIQAVGKIALYQFIVGCTLISALPISFAYLYFGFDPEHVLYIYLVVAIVAGAMRILFAKQLVGIVIGDWFSSVLLPISKVTLIYAVVRIAVSYVGIFEKSASGSVLFDFLFSVVIVIFFGLSSAERKKIFTSVVNRISFIR